jgi:hypothetical protein
VPCRCDGATGKPQGHTYVMCWTCKREYREGGCDVLVDGYDTRPDVSGAILGGPPQVS